MKILENLLDLLYPPKCMICHKLLKSGEREVCQDCLANLPKFTEKPPKPANISKIAVCFYYEDSFRESFHRYKFSGLQQYAVRYGTWMTGEIQKEFGETPSFDLVTWVSVSKKRLRERGYDQSRLLAEQVAKNLSLPLQTTLVKIHDTKPQFSLKGAAERKANVLGVYAAVHTEQIAGKHILLIDDILTTGATLSEAARVLRMAGAGEIDAAVLAAVRPKS